MTVAPSPSVPSTSTTLEDRAIALVRTWLAEAAGYPVDSSAAQLAGVLKDPDGLAFTVGFVDGVVRPEDRKVAARRLRELAPGVPRFLPAAMRGLVRLGGVTAPILPDVVVPIARAVLRRMVGHLIIDATDAKLGAAIQRIRKPGIGLNMNLLGEAVLGKEEASKRLAGTIRLIDRPDVDYVSIKVSATVQPHSPWAFEEAVADIVAELRPLFRRAVAATPHKFINLDMEEYKDLDLTIAVFTELLDDPEFLGLEAGIVLQAYLPDALGAMQRLQTWSAARRARGGAGIKVRLVKGANLPMERVEASLHGWALATWNSKQDSDTHYKQVLEWALTPERVENVRLGVAGHNLFDVARAWLLAGDRGVQDAVEFEMLLGMAQGQAEAVRRTVGSLLLYTPVVHPAEFDVAIAYLIRRLEEGASTENFMSAVFELTDAPELFAREEERFRAAAAAIETLQPGPHRTTDRFAAVAQAAPGRFENTPDSDPSVAENRAWAREILRRAAASRLGSTAIDDARLSDEAQVDAALERANAAGRSWGAVAGAERSRVLHAIGDAIETRRADLIEVMASEAGKTVEQADVEVSEAADFAHFYGELAARLDDVDGATFVPAATTLITPPWNFPVAIPAGGVLASLAAGSAALLKPAGPAERCGAVVAEIIGDALAANGAPAQLLQLVQVDENDLGRTLIAHPRIDRVILTGAYETAELFRSFRPDLPLLAETSGKNAIIVTPSADIDLAVKDIVQSAFGHAGQKCSAASLVVLVGSVGESKRFHRQLEDAVRSLTVGYPTDPTTQMGPIIEPASGKLLDGLTRLGSGERWVVAPRRLDDTGRLWSPGLRDGVRRGSEYHRVEYFGPLLGLMRAGTLDEAVDVVNEVDYGLTSGLHSLDPDEIATWLDRIEAGNLYVNRGITGAIVRRQPFGGWKKSAVGPGAKAGGENYLAGLGSWLTAAAAEGDVSHPGVRTLLERARPHLGEAEHASLTRAAASDARSWDERFGFGIDVSALPVERNVVRYLPFPAPVEVRLGTGEAGSLVRVLAAATLAGATVSVSIDPSVSLPQELRNVIRSAPVVTAVAVEKADRFARRIGGSPSGRRVRLIGEDGGELAVAVGGRPDIAIFGEPVTEAGSIELLPFLREQAVAITAHRFGTPNGLTDGVLASR